MTQFLQFAQLILEIESVGKVGENGGGYRGQSGADPFAQILGDFDLKALAIGTSELNGAVVELEFEVLYIAPDIGDGIAQLVEIEGQRGIATNLCQDLAGFTAEFLGKLGILILVQGTQPLSLAAE